MTPTTPILAVLALLVPGCAWITKDELAGRSDRDEDGYVAAQFGGDDCDDGDASVHPGATELCDGADDDCDEAIDDVGAEGGSAWYADADDDGYGDPDTPLYACSQPEGSATEATDCDDGDDGVHPGAEEICDGIDQDCDGLTDDDDPDFTEQTWWPDDDDDGYGQDTGSVTTQDCAAPEGYSVRSGDCNDLDPAISPGNAEICDGLDNDCDHLIDDADDGVTDQSAWYVDSDDDGYGTDEVSVTRCEAPAGFADNDQDCDDADDGVHPGATEHCDGLDEDCDGEADDSAVDVSTWYADTDDDGYGDDSVTTTACLAPTGAVAQGGDCDDADDAIHPGADETCSDEDHNCDGVPGDEDRDGDGVQGCAGDCDDEDASVYPDAPETCDGIDDDCDGLIDDDDPDLRTGGLTRYYPDADGDLYGDSSDPGEAACEAPADRVADHGDCDDGDAGINPDAYELCSTAADDDCDGATTDCTLTLDDSLLVFTGADSGEEAGAAAGATVDIDGDGLDDLVVASPGRYADKGAIYVVTGVSDADTDLGAATTWKGNSGSDRAGGALAGADLDRDGLGDVVVGAPGGGAVYLLTDALAGGGISGAEATISGDSSGAFGATLALGDLNGDGHPDVAVGAPDTDSSVLGVPVTGVGEVDVYFGPFPGDVSSTDGAVTNTDETDGHLGRAIATVDADGDGLDELVVSGLDTDLISSDIPRISLMDVSAGGAIDAGSALRTYSGGSGRASGDALAAGGDVDGDGTEDLLVGDSAGKQAFLLLGPLSTAPTSLSSADAVLSGSAGFGVAVLLLADEDGDGADEVVVGASSGASLWMGGAGFTGAHSSTSADLKLSGASSSDEAGAALSAGDVDGDGACDLIVGAPGADGASGEAIVVLGAPF